MKQRRSAFGELLRFHRRRRGLTQDQLAAQLETLASRPGRGRDPSARESLSVKTISNHERRWADPAKFFSPQLSTVRLLAEVLRLPPESPEYAEFFRAAEQTVEEKRAALAAGETPVAALPASNPAGAAWSPHVRPTDVSVPIFVPEGREPHIDNLRRAVARAAGGDPEIRFVHADPGSGKSWLVAEICRQAVEEYPGLVVLSGECVGRMGMADPHQPIRQALDLATGGVGMASPQQLVSELNRERLLARVPQAISALLEQGPGLIDRFVAAQTLIDRAIEFGANPAVQAALRRMSQMPFAARSPVSGPNEEFFRVLRAVAGAGPVILVIEDLHWADEGTCAALAHLAQGMHHRHLPLLVLGTYRPADLADARASDIHPFETLRHIVIRYFPEAELDLSTALGGEAGRAFIDGYFNRRLTRIPDSFRTFLFERTAGLPLFVDSMLRLCWQQGVLTDDGGTIDLVGEPNLSQLPAEINAVFLERVERIAPDLQRMLAWASVHDEAIAAEVLMRTLRLHPPGMAELLDEQLVRRYQLLRPGGSTTIAGQRVHRYHFAHGLLQDFLYKQLGDFERTHYHAATAAAYRELYDDGAHAGASAMAWHYERAGELVLAAGAGIAAGDYSMMEGNFELARHHFLHVSQLPIQREAPQHIAQSLIGLANCARAQGLAAEAGSRAREAIEVAARARSQKVWANSLATLAMIEFDAGRMQVAVEHLQHALTMLEELGERNESCRIENLLAYTFIGCGDYAQALGHARHALDLASGLEDQRLHVSALVACGNCHVEIGAYDVALAYYQRGLPICEAIKYPYGSGLCWVNLGLCWAEKDLPEEARPALANVLELSLRTPMPRLIGAAEFNAGILAERAGDLVEAQRRYQSSLDIRQEIGQDALIIDSLAGLLRIAVRQQACEQVRSLLRAVRARIAKRGIEGTEHAGRLYLALIQACATLGDRAGESRYLDEAMTYLDERASLLTDETMRASYLTNVPSHRELLALAANQRFE